MSFYTTLMASLAHMRQAMLVATVHHETMPEVSIKMRTLREFEAVESGLRNDPSVHLPPPGGSGWEPYAVHFFAYGISVRIWLDYRQPQRIWGPAPWPDRAFRRVEPLD